MKNNTGKSVLKTLGIIVIATIFGGVIGIASSVVNNQLGERLSLEWLAQGFGTAMYCILAVELVIVVYMWMLRRKIKSEAYSDDEDSTFTKKEKQMDLLQGIGTTLSVSIIPIFACITYYCGIVPKEMLTFLAIVAVNFYNEVAFVRLCGKVNPKLDADWSKFSMNQDIYNRMDEREKEKIGKVGAKLVTSYHLIFAATMLVLMLLNPIFQFSGFEFVVVGLLWGFFTLFINLESAKHG